MTIDTDHLIVLVPSRGRPQAAVELDQAFDNTRTDRSTELWVIVDADDPTIDDYPDWVLIRQPSEPNNMVAALNWGLDLIRQQDTRPFAIGFMGDDHRPRTPGWDTQYLQALREMGTGIVYGNDLLQRGRLPTQCAMTSDIPFALGKMAPRELRHMYVDNWWREIGNGADCLRYLSNTVVEHLHPIAGKAAWDAGYHRVNNQQAMSVDEAAYRRYCADHLVDDVDQIRKLKERH